MDIPPQLLLLLPVAVAAGLDLYLATLAVATAALLGVGIPGASPLGIVADPSLSPWVGTGGLLGLGCLYLAEAFAEARPVLAFLWHNLQLLFRPIGTALIALFLLWGEPPLTLLAGAAMAGVVAAFVHVLFWGQTILLRIVPGKRLPPPIFSLIADIASAVLLVLALLRPGLGFVLAILVLVSGLILGRSQHGAVRFGMTRLVDGIWGILSPVGWQQIPELPHWVQEANAASAHAGTSGARAGTWGVTGPGHFRDGWILQGDSQLLFVHRRATAVSVVAMSGIEEGVEVGPLWKAIRYRSQDGAQSALFLQVGLYGSESHK